MMKRILCIFTRWLYENCFSALVERQIHENLLGKPHVFGGDAGRVQVAPSALVANALFNVVSGHIRIEDHVSLGHNVCLLTGTHDPSLRGHDRQWTWPTEGRDIVIKEGAWLASNVTVVGPVTIGEHAVVAAGSLVNKDIPPGVIAAGSPARIIRKINHDNKT
jgi:acetyltransferase-like isoleucine patch superfamily enzyme